MRRIPFFLGIAMIIVTLTRVADFTGAGQGGMTAVLAWAVAVGLTLTVFVSAYFLGWSSTRTPAAITLSVSLLFDGALNILDVLIWSVETEQWNFFLDLGGGVSVPVYRFGHVLYGMFPTVIAALLGWLARQAENIRVNRKAGFFSLLKAELFRWLVGETEHRTANSEHQPNTNRTNTERTNTKPNSKPNTNRTPKGNQILAYLKDHPQATISEIVAEVGCSKSTAHNWRKQFKEANNGKTN